MTFPVPERLRDRVWDKQLDVLVEHRFFDLVLNFLATREGKLRLGKTIATGLSYPIYVVAMVFTPFITSNSWFVYIAEGLCVVGTVVSAISQLTDRHHASSKPLRDAYRDLSRIRDRFEDLWFYVDGNDSGETETQMLLGQLTSQFTELQNRFPGIQSKYAILYNNAEEHIFSAA